MNFSPNILKNKSSSMFTIKKNSDFLADFIIPSKVKKDFFTSLYKEWYCSSYNFNKYSNIQLPITTNLSSHLIESYYNLDDSKAQQFKGSAFNNKEFLNTTFTSKVETIQNNEEINLTFYVYDREEKFLRYNFKNVKGNIFFVEKISEKSKGKKIFNHRTFMSLLKKKEKKRINYSFLVNKSLSKKTINFQSLMIKGLDWEKKSFKSFVSRYYKNYLQITYKRQLLALYNAKLMHINNNKYKKWCTLGLKTILSTIYKKKVNLNVVNLKYLHYNSDNLTKAISMKLKNRDNKLLWVLKEAMSLAKVPSKSKSKNKNYVKESKSYLFNMKSSHINLDSNFVLKITDDKMVNGIRLETTGRLSKRLTASRSIFKYKHVGSLKNSYSPFKKISYATLRGHIKLNVQYTNINSKTRNGAFGIKGWVSSN